MAKRTAMAALGSADYTALIAEAAYYKAERRGFEPGHEMADWLEAEREIESATDKPRTRRVPAKVRPVASKPKKPTKA